MRIYDDLGIENLQGALNVEGSNPEGGEATHFSLMNVERGDLNPRTSDQITGLLQRPVATRDLSVMRLVRQSLDAWTIPEPSPNRSTHQEQSAPCSWGVLSSRQPVLVRSHPPMDPRKASQT